MTEYETPAHDEAYRLGCGGVRCLEVSRVDRASLEKEIRVAFHGVVLGQGVSLGQAQVRDRAGDGCSDEQLARLIPPHEIKNDWSLVPFQELDSDCIAHLDAEGLRYYLPALMLSVLDQYDTGSMRVIGTIWSLDPRSAYNEARLKMFTQAQRNAIAHFLESLPQLVNLSHEDKDVTSRSLDAYWNKFLVRT